MWDMQTVTTPKARKDYPCEACQWLLNDCWQEADYTPEEWQQMEQAKADGYKILSGQKYIKVSGKWEGEFAVFRARPEIDAICQKYDIYQE